MTFCDISVAGASVVKFSMEQCCKTPAHRGENKGDKKKVENKNKRKCF